MASSIFAIVASNNVFFLLAAAGRDKDSACGLPQDKAGVLSKGFKTRKHKKYSDKKIVKRAGNK